MEEYTMLNNDFWRSPEVIRMTPQEKYFYLYLFTNPYINHIGIYQISKKQIAFDLDHSLETVHLIMERFIEHYKLIRYNPETRELTIRDWGKHNL